MKSNKKEPKVITNEDDSSVDSLEASIIDYQTVRGFVNSTSEFNIRTEMGNIDTQIWNHISTSNILNGINYTMKHNAMGDALNAKYDQLMGSLSYYKACENLIKIVDNKKTYTDFKDNYKLEKSYAEDEVLNTAKMYNIKINSFNSALKYVEQLENTNVSTNPFQQILDGISNGEEHEIETSGNTTTIHYKNLHWTFE